MPRGANSQSAPSVASISAGNETAGRCQCAPGQPAMYSSSHHMPCTSQAAPRHNRPASGGQTGNTAVPASASGTIRKLTSGTASRLDSAPTSDASPKNHRLSGSNESVISHCPTVSSCTRPRQPAPRSVRQAIRKATPTKDSQNPASSTASGSTTNMTRSARASA